MTTFRVEAVDCQTNPLTGRWNCTAVVHIDEDRDAGRVPRRWLFSFTPVTHPESIYVITGISADADALLMDLDAVADDVVVLGGRGADVQEWLPVIARMYWVARMNMLDTYAHEYEERNAVEQDRSMVWRREELIDDAIAESDRLRELSKYLP